MNDTKNIDELLARLAATPAGLTADAARQRLQQYGYNETVATRQTALWLRFLKLFANPLALVLLLAAGVSGIMGDRVSASIIVVMVVLSAILDFVQTMRSQNAAERLRNQVAPVAVVLRDGKEVEVARRDIVPGDVIRLIAGDLVPADAFLLEARDLHVNQAALTGESLPVEKEIDGSSDDPDARNVFLGTSIVSGTASALVTATGKDTQFGDIVARLSARAPETDFERGTRQFGFFIMQTVFLLVMFVVIISLAFHRNTLESLLFAVALAVGLTPEFLPMITTVTLGEGALKMSRMNVIVKNLASIQNFGSMDILCSDKTGTLTSGEMTLDTHVDAFGVTSQRAFLFAYLNSLYESGVQDPTDAAVLHRARLNPLDTAILAYEHPDVHLYKKLDEIPFDFERRRISVVVGNEVVGDDGKRLLITKGAPESVLPLCSSCEKNGVVLPLDTETRALAETTYRKLGEQGYRVLAVGYRNAPVQAAYRVADEKDFTLSGYMAFIDPPLADAADAISQLRADGVTVKILTGDNEAVARHICSKVGLNADRIVLGSDMEAMSDPALAQVAEQTDIFARVSPAQKNRIILALKRRGHVVGYMGDGINDAPSLHAADVGISVSSAVDVAKDAASVILAERSLRVLHAGIIEGRKAFGNVMKYLLMGTSSNFGNMFSMAGAFLFLPFLPMLPTQILLNNFLYDFSQITIPTDNVDESFVHKPRKWNIGFIRHFMLYIGPISSLFDFLTFWVMLRVFHAGEALFHTAWFVESLATQTLVLFVIRTQGNPFRSRPSRPLVLTVLAIVATALVLPYTPVASVLGFVPLPASYFVFLSGATGVYLLLVEFVKRKLMAKLLY
ncbi:MAG TPA: magnesium-translocating P-type ATPase [Pseudomonadales bacterium]|nr:magnesium-translocating P-type ATPase [Pseudomonadales bacterium]